jgi:DNA-binding NarL/FixJ family response regulator
MSETPSPIRVLLADDHAVVRKGIHEFLEMNGTIKVIAEANNGESALQGVREHRPDVAVLDIQMPGRSGIEVTRAIRAEKLPVGILILTAFDDPPYVKAVLTAGANGYVLKSAEAQDIVDAVHAVHEGQSALSPQIAQMLMHQFTNTRVGVDAAVEPLSERELDVLRLAARGLTNKAIGMELDISDRTVQAHLARIYDKLQVASRTEAVMRAVALGWLPADLGSPPTP